VLQAKVSLKRLSEFLDNKELGKENVLQYPQSEQTGKSGAHFVQLTLYTNVIYFAFALCRIFSVPAKRIMGFI